MRLQVEAADLTRIGIRLSTADHHVSALLTHTPRDGWVMRMGDGGDGAADTVTRHLKPAVTPWHTALRLALAICEERLIRR